MVLGIDIDEVLRDFIGQLAYTYDKYGYGEIDLTEEPVKTPNLEEYFNAFETRDELNQFLYQEAALEIFGHADQLRENLINQFNIFLMDFEDEYADEEDHSIKVVSREAISSIPSTFFFLSKTGCRIQDITFVTKFEDQWDHVDALVTATPRTLDAKPEGKVAIKINCSYNEESEGDYEYDKVEDFFSDKQTLDKIINQKEKDYG